MMAEGGFASVPSRPVPQSWLVPNTSRSIGGQVGSGASAVPLPARGMGCWLSGPASVRGISTALARRGAPSPPEPSVRRQLCPSRPPRCVSSTSLDRLGEPERNVRKKRARMWLLDQFGHFLPGHSHLISLRSSFIICPAGMTI